MEKIINSQAINKNGRQSVYLIDWYNPPSIFNWLPTSTFKYSEINYSLVGYTKYKPSGVKNEQSKNQLGIVGIGGSCSFECAQNKQTMGGDALWEGKK